MVRVTPLNAMPGDKAEGPDGAPLGPQPDGSARVVWCALCGAVTGIRFAPGQELAGDPGGHEDYHRRRGEL